jgi:VRR-NUC domain
MDDRDAWERFIKAGAGAQAAVDLILESQFQQQVEDLATLYHWKKYHTRNSTGSEEGFPDLILIRSIRTGKRPRVRLIVAECKTARGELTDAQREWLDLFAEAGAETYVWRPGDLDKIGGILQ